MSTCADCGTDLGEIRETVGGDVLCERCYGLRNGSGPDMGAAQPPIENEIRIVTVADFAAVEEAGAEPVLGSEGEVVFPEDGDVMLYGDGGASKTTLGIDCAFHLAAGDDWLGISVPDPVRVLLIEAEGPRALFRAKLRAKRESWQGSEYGDRLQVFERPWADFRFPAEEIADRIGELEIDVLIVGPLTAVGMEELGTLQQVRDFMAEVAKFRRRSGRRLLVVLIHHENKGGKVSGAWEGVGDTLLHASVHSRGKTKLHFQKVRWSSQWHKETLELSWANGESFEPVEEVERDLHSEVVQWLLLNPHSTPEEIATRKRVKDPETGKVVKTVSGIGANEHAVKELLEHCLDTFRERTGEEAKALGRHPTAHLWEVKDGAPDA